MTVGIVLGTEAATTSGTAVNLSTAIPSGVRRIVVNLVGVSTNGTSPVLVQIGPSGGFETTGYVSRAADGTTNTAASTAGFIINRILSAAADAQHGRIVLDLEDSSDNTWTAAGIVTVEGTNQNLHYSAGSKAVAGVVDRIRITTVGGTDTFDAGVANISYEF